MTDLTLYHNPRCSKSRGALELLEARGLSPNVVRYLETPPTAAATTHSVNSSREPVRATCQSTHGNTRRPTTSINATKPHTCSSVHPSVCQMLADVAAAGVPPSTPANGGSRTSTSTMARSSTTSQPTAMRPV